ncbi:MAG: HD domain-containing protein [Candidatus Omnitrophica bacterium]|nr:HD domain-containing protein [Candidatus Omnitrophota bacterium]
MKPRSSKSRISGSIQQTSIVRKFTILFLLMSVIPTVVLYYFYTQIQDYGQIQLTTSEFNLTLIFIVMGVIVGYASMKQVLNDLVKVTEASRRALENILSPEKIRSLTSEQNEISILAQSFSAINERLQENIRSLELARRTLHAVMAKVGQGISNIQNIDTFLELILETVTDGLAGNVGMLLVWDRENNALNIKAVYGVEEGAGRHRSIDMREKTVLQSILKSKKPIVFAELPDEFTRAKALSCLSSAPLICAPLVIKEKALGMIIVGGRKVAEKFEEDDLNLLANVASQTAVSIENARLNTDMEKTYFETISALALAVDAKDKYSRGHLDRVADTCVLIARKLGLDAGDIQTLRDAARLHDLGKIGIPDEVLQKKGPLTEQDWELMKKHPEIGESIIKPIRSLSNLCDIVRHHHEKLDGSGYPDGLKADQISPLVRITTISDIYDALTSDRPYRSRMTVAQACAELRKMGGKLDQDIVEVFAEALSELEKKNAA